MANIVDNDRPRKQSTGSLAGWLVVVPARLDSSRLPAKPLADLGGLPLIVRVALNLEPLRAAGAELVVAVDDPSVEAVCREAGIPVVMTARDHQTGTDRCLEAARIYQARGGGAGAVRWVLNVQGDEPFLAADELVAMCLGLERQAPGKPAQGLGSSEPLDPIVPAEPAEPIVPAQMASMFFRCSDPQRGRAASTVKVVCDDRGHALYFSRSLIPHDRDGTDGGEFLVHMGVYAFSFRALEAFCAMPQGRLEQLEKLEQLRVLAAGWRILMFEAGSESLGIDTPADLEAARARFS